MRSSLLALTLALSLSAPAFAAQDTQAGDVPPKDAKADAKSDQDTIKASVEEDAQPVRRSISLRGKTLAYTVTPGHLTVRNEKGEPTVSMFYVAYTIPSAAAAPSDLPVQRRPGILDHVAPHGLVRADESGRVAAGNDSGAAVPLRRQSRHAARHHATWCSSMRRPPACRGFWARPRTRTSWGSTRTSTCLRGRSSAT